MNAPPRVARRRFGQNFLHDPRIIERIVDAIDPRPGQTIVEIGPGRAALTRALIARAGHLSAIEIDRDLAAWLRAEFRSDQLTLIEADALKVDWSGPPADAAGRQFAVQHLLTAAVRAGRRGRAGDRPALHAAESVVDRMVGPEQPPSGHLSVMLQWHIEW
jgi:16S rRNA (adenine1518-N6/adenine1519-N6)-dimethyltransferase